MIKPQGFRQSIEIWMRITAICFSFCFPPINSSLSAIIINPLALKINVRRTNEVFPTDIFQVITYLKFSLLEMIREQTPQYISNYFQISQTIYTIIYEYFLPFKIETAPKNFLMLKHFYLETFNLLGLYSPLFKVCHDKF